MKRSLQQVKALTFDVFGTVVDYRGTIIREMRALAEKKGLDVDPAAFADAWRDGYQPAMHRVRTGELPWLTIDVLHRMILDDLLKKFGIKKLKEADIADLNRVWHRLKPWPDSVRGLKRLKTKYIIAPLSNGNVSLLTEYGEVQWIAVGSDSFGGIGETLQTRSRILSHCSALARSTIGTSDDGRGPQRRSGSCRENGHANRFRDTSK